MEKGNKIHLEWAKVYWPQDYEVVDELKILKEENKKLKEENKNLKAIIEHYKKFEEWKKKLEWMLMEEDTLQELKDIGEI